MYDWITVNAGEPDAMELSEYAFETLRRDDEFIVYRVDGRCGVFVRIQDAGVGFLAGTSRLFETFYTTKPNGLGMGLAICRSIVEAHGGKLWAEHNEGPGATFCFVLPAAFPNEP
jgi:signal transduction histidine kinase